jgi:hypothetical protein
MNYQGTLGTAMMLALAASAGADSLTIPEGTAVELRLESALSTRTAKVGDRFETTVVRPVFVDGRLALPRGTKVQGVVEVLHSPRTGATSGVLGVEFDKLTVPGHGGTTIDAEMTSLRQDDRRKLIEEAPKVSTTAKSDVLIVGEAQGDGKLVHTVVGLRNTDNDDIAKDWSKTGMSPSEVDVSKGAHISMEMDKPVEVDAPAAGAKVVDVEGARYIFTGAATVKAAQEALTKLKHYSGPIDGLLTRATRRAVVRFQLEKNETPTGDLDQPTLVLLGVKP